MRSPFGDPENLGVKQEGCEVDASRTDFQESPKWLLAQHSEKAAAQQGAEAAIPEPTKIGACTPYDFHSKNLTAYGGLLPVATMLEKLEFQRLLEQTLTVKRVTRSMTMYQFVLAMVLALYVGFSRLNHLRFLAREPMLVGILKVLRLPPQCT